MPDQEAGPAREGAGHGRLRHHRPRRAVRRGGVLPGVQGRGHPSGDRVRGVRVSRHGGQALPVPGIQPFDSAVRERNGLPEPDDPGERGVHEGVLLPPPHGLQFYPPAPRGLDRPVRLHFRRFAQNAAGREVHRRGSLRS